MKIWATGLAQNQNKCVLIVARRRGEQIMIRRSKCWQIIESWSNINMVELASEKMSDTKVFAHIIIHSRRKQEKIPNTCDNKFTDSFKCRYGNRE